MSKQRQIFRDVLNFRRKQPPDAVAPSLIELQQQIDRLTEQNTKLAEEKAGLEQLLEQGIAEYTRLIDEAAEHERASDRYVRQIKDLQRESIHLAAETSTLTQENGRLQAILEGSRAQKSTLPNDVLVFFRALNKGDFRSDRHGPERYEESVALLFKYDK